MSLSEVHHEAQPGDGLAELSAYAARCFDNKHAWRRFVAEPTPIAPSVPSRARYRSMSTREQRVCDEARLTHLSRFIIETPRLIQIREAALGVLRTNLRRGPGARRGIVIDGHGALGKTTIATEIGRAWERELSVRFGVNADEEAEFVPVIYASMSATNSVKSILVAIAEFLEIPHRSSTSIDKLLLQVKTIARRCCTSLVIVDDIHYLQPSNKSDRQINNLLKAMANSLAATFVYAGIECEKMGLLSEGHGLVEAGMSQMRRRFSRFEVAPFALSPESSEDEWLSFLRALEEQLVLLSPTRGSLQRHSDYLFARTGGYMGSVVELIRGAGALAIQGGSEKITMALLDEIEADYAAEGDYLKFQPGSDRSRRRGLGRLQAQPEQRGGKRAA